MRYRISEIKIDPKKVAAQAGGISDEVLFRELDKAICKSLGRKYRKNFTVSNIEIIRESVDARKKPAVKLVYTVDFDCEASIELPSPNKIRYCIPNTTDISRRPRPVIAGFGPCGIFAALILAEAGLAPIVVERGKAIEERVKDVETFWRSTAGAPNPESNVQFGEGGAGTFSDGKLTTGIKDIRIRKVLEAFVEAGADSSILYKHKPHIGTDKLRQVVTNLRKKIESLGGEVRFSTRLEGINLKESCLNGVKVRNLETDEQETIETENLILAVGHSARDTFGMLHEAGFDMVQKAFSIGVRMEHPQHIINKAQYGDESLAEILGAADYKLSYKCSGLWGTDAACNAGDDNAGAVGSADAAGRGVYTFCMCPGGEVVNASTEPETSVTNGMSNGARDGEYANSAVLVDVRTSDFGSSDPLAGIAFQQKYEHLAWENRTENGMARCTYGEFAGTMQADREENGMHADREESEMHEQRGLAVRNSLPAFAREAILEAVPEFGKKLKGFDDSGAGMYAVESRSSSPVRILRDGNMEIIRNGVAVKGIIPAGEGPGYAGGIMSAAVDGIKAAEAVLVKE